MGHCARCYWVFSTLFFFLYDILFLSLPLTTKKKKDIRKMLKILGWICGWMLMHRGSFLGVPPLSFGISILIKTMMHQHFVLPGSIEVCQHLLQPVRVNRLADMTCPAPVMELLAICLPWLSCCHISGDLGPAYHIFIRWDKGIKEHIAVTLGLSLLMDDDDDVGWTNLNY